MRTIARITRGTLTVLLAGAIVVPAIGSTAYATDNGKGNGKAHSSSGANGDCGEYCSTRDGSPSRNGNGAGEAKGRPCAGCVGKADDKNPPGQYPNGSDANNGYECDGNSGIGRSNPAHTGCTPQAAPVQEPVAAPVDAVEEPSVEGPAPVEVPVEVAPRVEGVKIVGTAGAQAAEVPEVKGVQAQYGPNVLGTRFERPASPVAANRGTLPFTGGGWTLELLLGALALVGTGVLVTRAGSTRA